MRQLQDEVNELERKESEYKNIFKQVNNMGIIDRLLGRYPEDIKALKG